MKKIFPVLAALIALIALTPAKAAEYELTFGHIQHPGHDLYAAPEHLKKLVEERSGGRLSITIYPSSQLGTTREMMEQCVMGTLDITFAGSCEWATAVNAPEFAMFEMPFLYNSLEEQKKLIDGILTPEGDKWLEGTGVKMLLNYSNSIRNALLKNKPITKIEDLKGLKMRCPENPLFVKTWEALGCNTVTSPWSEVYTVLSQGVADAAEADIVGLINVNLQEVGRYYSRTAHMGAVYTTCINEDAWNNLPEDLQEILMECARESETVQLRGRHVNDAKAEEAMAAAGVAMNSISPGERARMRAAMRPIYDAYAKEHGLEELVERTLNMVE